MHIGISSMPMLMWPCRAANIDEQAHACLQVAFEQVPDLVAQRRVLLRRGWAYVSR